MAPKRRVSVVVRSTKKIVRETVQVAVVQKPEGDSGDQELLETVPFEDIAEEGERIITEISLKGLSKDKARKESQIVQVPVESPGKNKVQKEQQTEQVPAEEPRKDEAQKQQQTQQIPTKEPGNEASKFLEAEPTNEASKVLEEERSDEAAKALEEEPSNETSKALEVEPPPLKKEEERKAETREGEKKGEEKKGKTREGEETEKKTTRSREGRKSNENVKRKRGKRKDFDGNEAYKTYVFKVLKQVHPGMAISSQAMSVINSLMNDMFDKIADEAIKLSKYTERKTLSAREIQGAVRLVLPGELGKHAVAEGSKAVTNYASYYEKGSKLD
ncbi:hypothetical protein CRYUN_Cryun11dG0116100 [Craigia yunnanensis]